MGTGKPARQAEPTKEAPLCPLKITGIPSMLIQRKDLIPTEQALQEILSSQPL
jgi:hypothetical protein